MIVSTFQKRVRYAEVDKMGYLYYGHYAQLFEIGRAEFIRDLGISYRDMEDKYQVMMPVLDLHCRYLRSAYYDDLLKIETRLEEMPTKMITFKHRVFNEEEQLLHKGEVKLFFIDMTENRRISCPDFLIEKIGHYFES